MEETGIDGEVLREVCDLAEKYHIQKVILFGSRARGDFKRTSDIDLAVKGGDFTRFYIVDLARKIQPELRESIEREGKILYEKI